MTETLEMQVQRLEMDALVEMFQLDATGLGGDIYYFTASSNDYDVVVFDGIEYTPVEIEASGFEWSGKGAWPTPHIKINNNNLVMTALVITYQDLLGAYLTRIRTFRQFLDDGDTPDPTQIFPLDIYRVERKVSQNKNFIEWELSAAVDQQGRMIPGRQVLRDACTHIYRSYVNGAFDYTKASCPYTGTALFDVNDNSTLDPRKDICGKRLSSCKARFGQTATLPTRAFPGVRRI